MNKVIKWSHNLMITQLILYFTNKNLLVKVPCTAMYLNMIIDRGL